MLKSAVWEKVTLANLIHVTNSCQRALSTTFRTRTGIMTNPIMTEYLNDSGSVKVTFDAVAGKLQSELIDIIENSREVNEYELIVYKYVFITELGIPLFEDLGGEIDDDSFIIYVIPDALKLDLLRRLDDALDRFEVTFMPNSYNLLKLRFKLM